MNAGFQERVRLMEAVTKVFGWLRSASKQIGREYMMLPVAGSDPQNRERVYCYELYHRLRSRWDHRFPFSLCGEIDKRNHAYVHGGCLEKIKPDLLIHRLGWMNSTSNLLAIEVKPANAEFDDMRIDLRKLTALRRKLKGADKKPANYNYAALWIYGRMTEGWPKVRSKILHRGTKGIDTKLIRCFIHEGAGRAATEVFWE